MKKITLLLTLAILTMTSAIASEVAKVRVYKSERKLILLDKKNQRIKEYDIMLGRSPIGKKERQGDNKTPEGAYILDYKNAKSKFYKSIHVNYPNKYDLQNAKLKGIKDPGDNIMIHGLPNDFGPYVEMLKSFGLDTLADSLIRQALPFIDWTQGCIAVTDLEMEEIYNLVKTPTPLFIYP